MKINEKSNLLIIDFDSGEDLIAQLLNISKTYKITESYITGYGYASKIEYGYLIENDKLLYKKNNIEDIITITSFYGSIKFTDIELTFNAIGKEGQRYQGFLFNLTVLLKFKVRLEILKTE